MAAHAITLQLPASLYEHFQSRAERAHRTLERELLDAVATVAAHEEELAPDLDEAIEELALLRDEELTYAARNRLSDETKAQLESLNAKQQAEGLAPAEKKILTRLIDQYDRAVLLRAEALRILKERGRDVSELLTDR